MEGSDIDTEGKVMFRDAPGGRGTEVKAPHRLSPALAAAAGRAVARLFQAETRRPEPARPEASEDADGNRRGRHKQ